VGRGTLNHRRILAGLYLLFGLYLVAEIVLSYRETIDGLVQYFEGTSEIYAYISAIIVFLIPISCLALSYLVNAGRRNLIVYLLLMHTLIVFPIGLLIAPYFLWWYLLNDSSRAT